MMHWIALSVTSQREFRVEQEIKTGLGLTTCVPYARKYRKARGRQGRLVLIPYKHVVMPGYVFARVGGSIPWRDLVEITDVRGLIQFDGKIGLLTDAEVDRIRSMAPDIAVDTRRSLTVGDPIQITQGPFGGMPTIIDAIRGGVVSVTVQMFGRSTELKLPIEAIEKAA